MTFQIAKRFKEQDAREQHLLFDLFTQNKQSGIKPSEIEQSLEEKRQAVASEIYRQVLQIFKHIDSDGNIDNQSTEHTSLSFKMEVKKSSISGAGNGVFIQCTHQDGFLSKGSVVCLYRGLVYLPSDLNLVYPHIYMNNNYLITRHDEIILDGCEEGTSSRVFDMSLSREKARAKGRLDYISSSTNPFAVGQYINHSTSSNVIPASYDFPLDFPSHLQKYIPNLYFSNVPAKEVLMRSVVMVTIRDIQNGEEIFMDYKLNPKGEQVPDWYKASLQTTSKTDTD